MSDEGTENYLWDEQLLGGKDYNGESYYCLKDHLGSVINCLTAQGIVREHHEYDAFGQEMTVRQITDQPFGYTGYLWDPVSGTNFAQTREYIPALGRFASKDQEQYMHLKLPQTINPYQYCMNNTMIFVDPLGTDCYIFYLPEWEAEARVDQRQLAQQYHLDESQVHLMPIRNNQELTDGWNGMGTVNGQQVDIDAVVIDTHANHSILGYGNNSNDKLNARNIQALQDKDMDALILYGCNAGHADYFGSNVASEFARRTNGAPVLASDGTVYGQQRNGDYDSRNDDHFRDQLVNGNRDNEGWMVYRYRNDRLEVSDGINKGMNVRQMLEKMKKAKLRCV